MDESAGKATADGPTDTAELVDGWRVWRTFAVRSAGFPVEQLEALASEPLAAFVASLVRAEADALAAQTAAGDALKAGRDALPQDARAERRAFGRAIKRLFDGHPVEPEAAWAPAIADAVARARAAAEAVEARRGELPAVFERELASCGERTRELARDPRFHEAIVWQNRAAWQSAIAPLLRTPATVRDHAARKRERLVANYAQRYCAKNDTIGFFGPLAWGTFADAGPALSLRAEPTLLGSRRTFLEFWTLDAVAKAVAALPGMRPWLAPRRMPLVRLEGTALRTPMGELPLGESQARLLAACTGEASARDIAAALARDPQAGFADEAAVLAMLEEFAARDAIIWTVEIPTIGRHEQPRVLRAQVERVGEPELRARALAMLDELEAARAAVAAAAGEPAALDAAIAAFEATFTRLTGKEATRLGGKLYAGRTLVFEECRRQVALALGPSLRTQLGQPLSLLLTAARWFSEKVAETLRAELEARFRQIREQAGTATVPAIVFWKAIQPYVLRDGTFAPILAPVIDELRRRWAQVIDAPAGARVVERTYAGLVDRVGAAFPARGPGYPYARYHSPDVMIAAESAEAVARGEYTLVMGEIHAAVNTLEQEPLFDDFPDREAFLRSLDREVPFGRIRPAVPPIHAGRTILTAFSRKPSDVSFEMRLGLSWRPRAQTVAIMDLEIAEIDGRFTVRHRDTGQCWDGLSMLEVLLADGRLPLLEPAPHRPRVVIDRLVVERESWHLPAAELAFAALDDERERFVGAQRFRHAHGMPRRVFVSLTAEKKPFYVDFASPALVETLAHLVRRSTAVTVSEMLPGPDECWLVDHEGRRYACELRMVFVDPLPFEPPA